VFDSAVKSKTMHRRRDVALRGMLRISWTDKKRSVQGSIGLVNIAGLDANCWNTPRATAVILWTCNEEEWYKNEIKSETKNFVNIVS